jgi:hypothetical protein
MAKIGRTEVTDAQLASYNQLKVQLRYPAVEDGWLREDGSLEISAARRVGGGRALLLIQVDGLIVERA